MEEAALFRVFCLGREVGTFNKMNPVANLASLRGDYSKEVLALDLGSHCKQLFDPMYNFDSMLPGAKCYLAITIYPSAIVLTRPELENRISTCYQNTGHGASTSN